MKLKCISLKNSNKNNVIIKKNYKLNEIVET